MKLIITETFLDDEQLKNAVSNALFKEYTNKENRDKFKEWSYNYLDKVTNNVTNEILKYIGDIFSVKQNDWKNK